MNKKEHERRMTYAREKARELFQNTGNAKIMAMDVCLAEEFAKILVVEMYKPNLGCATTGELIEEIKARIELNGDLNYKTINDDEFDDKTPIAWDTKFTLDGTGRTVGVNKAKPFTKYKCEPPPNDEEMDKAMESMDKAVNQVQKEHLKNIKIIESVDIETDKIYHMNPVTFNKLKDAGIVR